MLGVGWYTDSLSRTGAALAFAAPLPAAAPLICSMAPSPLPPYVPSPPLPAELIERPSTPVVRLVTECRGVLPYAAGQYFFFQISA